MPANVFDSGIFENAWKGWEERFGIVHAGLFLHLFDWDQQLAVCEKIIRLMSGEKGSLFLGEMVGCEGGGERCKGKGIKFWEKGERKQYLHDEKTFEKMWGEVADRTRTVGMWKVEGAFRKRVQKEGGDESRRSTFFTGEGIGWLTFSVERI